ncbi:hypothetical protein GCM10020331_070600 [Ectobacillus funiculus]
MLTGKEKLAAFMTNIVHAAKEQSAKLAIVDNIYAYGRSPDKKVDEAALKQPHTKKRKASVTGGNNSKGIQCAGTYCSFP